MKVKSVHLFSAHEVPGLGRALKQTIEPKFYPDLTMETHPLGVLCTGKDDLQFIILASLIKVIILAPLEKKATNAKKAD